MCVVTSFFAARPRKSLLPRNPRQVRVPRILPSVFVLFDLRTHDHLGFALGLPKKHRNLGCLKMRYQENNDKIWKNIDKPSKLGGVQNQTTNQDPKFMLFDSPSSEMLWCIKGGPENPKAKRQQTNLSNTDNWFISFSPLASFFLEDEHYGRIHCNFHFSPPARWGLLDFIGVVLLG